MTTVFRAINDLWDASPERAQAFAAFESDRNRTTWRFEHSQQFKDARLAFRRRVNGSTDAETT